MISTSSLLLWLPLVVPAGGEVAAESPALASALDSIRAANISADLHFFASDAMKGRDTPSPEQRIAARFLAARLERLGFEPAGAEGGWFWEYELPTVRVDAAASSLVARVGEDSFPLSLGGDYAFWPGRLTTHDVTATGICYGGTLTEEEAEGLEMEGRWLLVRSPADQDLGNLRRVTRRGKAAGVLIMPGGELDAAAMARRVEEYARDGGEPRLSRGGARESRSIPYLHLTESAARRLMALGGVEELAVGAVAEVELQEVRALVDDETAGLENVVGLWPGSDPELSRELIILSAHYDHVGVNDEGEVFNGADDNGSGSMCLLNVAEALTHYGPMRRSVLVIWVSGEEKGLLGSAAWTKAWAEKPYLEGLTPVVNLNIDMVGRNAPEKLMITPTAEHEAYNGLTRLAEANRAAEGFAELESADAYWSRSDHANFSQHLGIPVAFLFSDVHEDYHKVTDTPDKIDFDKVRRVARLVVRMLDGLQADVLELD
jgi:hypothetical protein